MIFYIFVALLSLILIFLLCNKRIQSSIEYVKKQRAIEFKKRTNLDLYTLTRLSAPAPFNWGLETFLFKRNVFYFDNDNLYITKSNDPVTKYPLSIITEVRRTNVMINDRRVWKIIINNSGKQIIYKIRSYRNFGVFLEKIKENPNASVDDQYIWGIFE
ncbi:hypothetical protein C8C83_5519 [Flavobacterium sp. 90]|uniref:hypothetical protein n=1 Tax=unclassified Flavobacterium TaxID=196869 RepID=UPI000EB5227A|nr:MULTISPECIES: hypothetical protein [unclassified Flavobacterium]RKR08282.1 hypothetical protein C8C82_0149 [Flavobacterium sp. 81]TCK57470.1 hypothetical protein C8C83_5519 [Flavobacterium sp. 90]